MSPKVAKGRVKGNKRLFLNSTIDDVIHTPLRTKSGKPLTLLEYWKKLSPEERAKILAVRREKTLLQTLFRDLSLSETAIQKRMRQAGYKISREQIALLRKVYAPNRLKFRQAIAAH